MRNLRGKKIALFFNEGIMCYPACWNQIASLGSDKRLNTKDIFTASVVTDSANEWNETNHKLPELSRATVLLDTDKNISNKYGTLNLASSMHRGMKPGHSYVLIDQNGIVRYTFDDPKMGLQNDRLVQELQKI